MSRPEFYLLAKNAAAEAVAHIPDPIRGEIEKILFACILRFGKDRYKDGLQCSIDMLDKAGDSFHDKEMLILRFIWEELNFEKENTR